MLLTTTDWIIIGAYFLISLLIGLAVSRKSSDSASEFFLSGRSMPWWLLGISMVATTFSADTPNLVTDLVRRNGVAGNWAWWAFLLTGMLTVFVYARLWRRSAVLTDLEFYELRYSGKAAAFLRGFRAIYLGVFFNVIIMATVCLAAVKIGSVMLGLSPAQTLWIACTVTVVYSAIGGFAGVLWTDFFQFILAIVGAIWASVEILHLPEIGGLDNLLSHPEVASRMSLLPDFSNPDVYMPLFVVPLAVQWWSVWYPGAEPGGGGYVAQRMLSAKNEKHAVGATLLFNVAHYALRPWPWILVAFASLVLYPQVSDIAAAFPGADPSVIGHDIAYPAMLTHLSSPLRGIIMASLIAAFMSTIATHLNWGSSYVVNDVYLRFINPKANSQAQINVARLSTVVLMLLGALLSTRIQNAGEGFNILLSVGAGTGLIFILRWFWWRINAYTEIAGMASSLLIAVAFYLFKPDWPDWVILIVTVVLTTLCWMLVTWLTPPTSAEVLARFYTLIKPSGRGWRRFAPDYTARPGNSLGTQVMSVFLGCVAVYAALFGVGFLIYGNTLGYAISAAVTACCGYILLTRWRSSI